MADQFDVIEAGGQGRRRRWTGVAVLVALLAIPVAGLLAGRDPEPDPRSLPPGHGTTRPAAPLTTTRAEPNLLQVTPRVKGGDEVLRVVFPDGAPAEVRYPSRVGLAALGSRPFQGVWVAGQYRRMSAPYGGEAEVSKGGPPLRSLTPNVDLWPRQPGSGSYGQVLLFAFGHWRLALYDRPDGLSFEQRMAAAGHIRGRVTKGGYLVLTATPPVRLAAPGETVQGDPVGPQLWFGGVAGDVVGLIPVPDCGRASQPPMMIDRRGRSARVVCRDGVQIAAAGSPAFVERAVKEIRITLK
ncbi:MULTISPECIES: hypothetical protein [unclassified Nonomuraea]|uniref:hypothetical protein n=1 Tax=unclassified Nonomuraea TaxID=2593643 RepID=UPI0033EF89FB